MPFWSNTGISVHDFPSRERLLEWLIQDIEEVASSSNAFRKLRKELLGLQSSIGRMEQLARLHDSQQSYRIGIEHAVRYSQDAMATFLERTWVLGYELDRSDPVYNVQNMMEKSQGKLNSFDWTRIRKRAVQEFGARIRGHTLAIGTILKSLYMSIPTGGENGSSQHLSPNDGNNPHGSESSVIKLETSSFPYGYHRTAPSSQVASQRQSSIGLQPSLIFLFLQIAATYPHNDPSLRKITLGVLATSLKIFVMAQQTQQRYKEPAPQVERQQPIHFEDALGRISPIHPEFINDFPAFQFMLEVQFRKAPGFSKVKRGEYALHDDMSPTPMDLTKSWESIFQPGRKVEMSMVFSRKSQSDRVVELDDEGDDVSPSATEGIIPLAHLLSDEGVSKSSHFDRPISIRDEIKDDVQQSRRGRLITLPGRPETTVSTTSRSVSLSSGTGSIRTDSTEMYGFRRCLLLDNSPPSSVDEDEKMSDTISIPTDFWPEEIFSGDEHTPSSKGFIEAIERRNIQMPSVGEHIQSYLQSVEQAQQGETDLSTADEFSDSLNTQGIVASGLQDSRIKRVKQVHNGSSQPCGFMTHIRVALSASAESIGQSEKALKPGWKRARWTCICGRKLYDDFLEFEPGAVDEVHNDLDAPHQMMVHEQSYQPTGSPVSSGIAPQDDSSVGQTGMESRDRQDGKHSNTTNVKGNSSAITSHSTTENSIKRWVIPCFQFKTYGSKAIHVDVTEHTSDKDMFVRFRELYFQERSWFQRLVDLRAVKRIHYINFDLVGIGLASIRKTGVWPPESQAKDWQYSPCPATEKILPLVGHTYLMHIWQYPHHADREAYRAWQQKRGIVSRMRDWFHHLPYFSFRQQEQQKQATTTTKGRPASSGDPEQPGGRKPPCSSYIFVRTPKKLGDQLQPTFDDAGLEGWGMFFEEGFRIHRLCILFLIMYILVSIIFVIAWEAEGEQQAGQKLGSVGVASWMTGLASLGMTVWFTAMQD